jgi:hypothetical protein
MSERAALEIEVLSHRVRVAELAAALADLERNIAEGVDAPDKLRREASLLRMELKGRAAAVEVGSARLRMIRD